LEKLSRGRASEYPAAAKIRTRLYPPQKAINRANTELITEEKALVAHPQGMSLFSSDSKIRIPVGKGKPIKKPRGNRIKKVRMILSENLIPRKLSKKSGRRSI
jgi:hypothetical protein